MINRLYGKWTPVYRTIQTALESVEDRMRRALHMNDPFLDAIVQHSFLLGGKRLRPALVLLCGKIGVSVSSPDDHGARDITESHLRSAAALEMIHTGTLIHDDILDGALRRRNMDTLNIRWNSEVSVLAGDALFMRALRLVTETGSTFEYRELAEASYRTCEGELRQIGTRGRFDLTESEYRHIVADKTAALMEASCVLGAYHSFYPETDYPDTDLSLNRSAASPQEIAERVAPFRRFGEHLGVAFQMADDMVDWTGDETVTGKTLGTDYMKLKPTLPFILFLETLSPTRRQQFCEQCTSPNEAPSYCDVREWITASGALDRAREKVRQEITAAKRSLDGFTGEAVQDLCRLADTIV